MEGTLGNSPSIMGNRMRGGGLGGVVATPVKSATGRKDGKNNIKEGVRLLEYRTQLSGQSACLA